MSRSWKGPWADSGPGFPLAAVLVTAASLFLFQVAQAAWIPAKAVLAQWLLERSWERTEQGEPDSRPWPWADTRAIARMRVPSMEVDQIILAGNSGRNLAFGPVLADSLLNSADWIISGHRDTHFRFLENLDPGDVIEITYQGRVRTFQVQQADVIDGRNDELVIEPGTERISLVTCYPFDAASVGGPLRYVVTALPVREYLDSSPPLPSSG